ncbi:MAG: cob(I)yrinic acid a,c-diamide adenosyltransferase, partial [Methanobacteriota archaeon]
VRVDAYGTVDELNSHLGYAISLMEGKDEFEEMKEEMVRIQSDLFDLGSALATSGGTVDLSERISELERQIDRVSDKLPPLRSFILPGGTSIASSLHICRTVTRRAERKVVALAQGEGVDPGILQYLNRLSDLLFVWARLANQLAGREDIAWSSRQ